MKFKCLLLSIVFNCMILILSISPSFSADYYVKNGGNDSANGLSDADAWATIAKINYVAAAHGFHNGDTINLKRGSTWSESEGIGWDGGSVNWGTISGLTIQDYGSGALPRINGNIVRPIFINGLGISNLTIKNIDVSGMDWTGENYSYGNVTVYYVDGVVVDGIYADCHTGASSYVLHGGIISIVDVDENIEVKNCEIKNAYKNTFASSLSAWGDADYNGIIVWYNGNGTGTPKTDGTVSIHDNTIQNVFADSIALGGLHVTTNIYNNTISGFGENGVDQKSIIGANIYNNDMSHNDFGVGESISGAGGPSFINFLGNNEWPSGQDTSNITVHDNYFHDSKYPSMSPDHGSVSIYNNYFKDVGHLLILGSDEKIYNNLFVLTNAIDTSINGGVQLSAIRKTAEAIVFNVLIYNNTFYISGSNHLYGIAWQARSWETGNEIKNNIIQMTNNSSSVFPLYMMDYDGTNNFPTVSYNDYYNANSSNRVNWDGSTYSSSQQTSWISAGHSGALFGDPSFTDPTSADFTLQAGSPCISAATDIGDDYKDGWNPNTSLPGNGVSIDTLDRDVYGWDMGAIVFVGAQATGTLSTGFQGSNVTESQIVAGSVGGEDITIIITLVNTTWDATLSANNAVSQAFIDGFDSAQSEAGGWNAKIRDVLDYTAITRDVDNVTATLTVPATADYDITANETITMTVDASCVAGTSGFVADGNLVVSNVTPAVSGVGLSYRSTGRTYTHSATGRNITIGQ